LVEVTTRDYVVVNKAVLGYCDIRPFKDWPSAWQLTPAVRSVLAITPEESKPVEAAFAAAQQKAADWAQSNLRWEGASNEMLISFTIPTDTQFERTLTNELFSSVANTIGQQRTELLRQYFDIYRIYEDGAIGSSTNKLSIWRVPGKSGLFYKAGWDMGRWSAINTYPEPIQMDRFPVAFRFVFPGGWEEIAQREGLQLQETSHSAN